jgi:hypothetical protein
MRYRDVAQGNRFRLPASHPILTKLVIDPADWCHLQRLDAENPGTQIIGHDDSHDGQMTIYVACASSAVQDRLRDGWG